MTTPGRLPTLALALALAAAPGRAQDAGGECPNPKGWQPSPEELQATLQAHQEWLFYRGQGVFAPGGAVLCNADLFLAQLQGADLSWAQLQGATLWNANLQGANLHDAQLEGANLSGARLQGADLSFAWLGGAVLRAANLQSAHLPFARLQGADLGSAQLQGAVLRSAWLDGAKLLSAQLQGADLTMAQLEGAVLVGARLQDADLENARLSRADLGDADLSGTDLRRAELRFASLRATNLEGAKLSGAALFGALYEAAAAPARGYLTGLQGLTTLHFTPGQDSGLVQLRAQLIEAGLRGLEREATYAIERNRTRHLLFHTVYTVRPEEQGQAGKQSLAGFFSPQPLVSEEQVRWHEPLKLLEASGLSYRFVSSLQPRFLRVCGSNTDSELLTRTTSFRLAAFEWPVAYGLYPGRALLILLSFILVFSIPYMVALVNPLTRHAGIWRVWAEDRVLKQRGQDEPERLEDDWYGDPWWRALYCVPLRALQFSILSAFHLGWREFNVGTWLARLQTREYTLQATGWVRAVAGLQSLLSVYLLALWALTYFGRPFQ